MHTYMSGIVLSASDSKQNNTFTGSHLDTQSVVYGPEAKASFDSLEEMLRTSGPVLVFEGCLNKLGE